MDYNKFTLHNLWFPVLAAVLSLVFSVLLSIVSERIGFYNLLISMLIIFTIYLIVAYVFYKLYVSFSLEMLSSIKDDLSRYLDKGAISWLMTSSQLSEYEASVKSDDIWIVTMDLSDDIPGSSFYEVVENNLKRGVKYIYFVPKNYKIESRVQELLRKHSSGELKVVYLSNDFFFLMPKLDFAIYDPFNKSNNKNGWMALPVKSDTKYHGIMDHDFLDILIGKLNQLLNEQIKMGR